MTAEEMLYECNRCTVVDRNLHVALAGEVPAAVCEAGPYHLLSYMIAFVGVAVAFPRFWCAVSVC
jgi:hypothetical protein